MLSFSLVGKVSGTIDGMHLDGIVRPWVKSGAIGAEASSLGGAILPLYSNYAPNGTVLLNLPV